ncbi:mucin-binding protein [Limosilactobacillus sp.]|uniref:mucin-binding protein n=1 Tax=Limosilactobacillus sp. TaxID=2773925 RepID=UPI003F0697EA
MNYADLHKTVTRTIAVHKPNCRPQIVIQVATLIRTAQVDEVTHKVSYGTWKVDGNGGWAQFTAPIVAGYTASGDVAAVVPDGETADTTVVIDYAPNQQTGKISYVDSQGKEIGHTVLTGVTNGTVAISPVAPTGWKISADNNIPSQVTADAGGIKTVTVRVEHDCVTVEPSDPKTPADVIPNDDEKKFPAGVAQDDLNKTITRTITVNNPHGGKEVTVQRVTSTRTALVDMVDGTVTYGDWSVEKLPEFTTPAITGYTPNRTMLSEQLVSGADKDIETTISYTPDAQYGFIQYIYEKDGTVIGYTPFESVTDEPVAIVLQVPVGWKPSDPNDVPKTVTPQPGQKTIVKVKVGHDHVTVKPTEPKTTADVIPNDGGKNYPSGVAHDDLNKTVIRTINVAFDTDAHSPYSVIDSVSLSREATVDMVTGEVTYGKWKSGAFSDWNAPEIKGYTPNYPVIVKQTPTGDTPDQVINVVYYANDGRQTIEFVDGKQVVDTQVITGKVDHDIAVPNGVPAGWKVADGHSLPTTVKITAGDEPILIPVEHDHVTVTPTEPKTPADVIPNDGGRKFPNGLAQDDLNRAVTRTIIVTRPDGSRQTITQTAKLQRTATVNMVTLDVEYSDWVVIDNGWGTFELLALAGYTPTIGKVLAVAVDGTTTDTTIRVTYTANPQTGVLRYVDPAGNEIAHDDLTGHTGESIDIRPQAPAGWIVDDEFPSAVTAGPDGIPTVTMRVKHNVITVQPSDLPNKGDQKPGNPNKQPGDGKANDDIAYGDLHKDVTRTITIHNPLTGDQFDIETISYERTAQIDDVDGNVSYDNWTFAQKTAQTKFNNVDYPLIPGYMMEVTAGDHGETVLTQDQINNWTDPKIEVNYVAIGQTQVVNYVDEAGKVISQDTLQGKTGDDVIISPVAPNHYRIKAGQNIPGSVTLTANNPAINIVIIPQFDQVTDPAKLNKTISRKIIVNVPNKAAQVINQAATFKRTGVTNEVTGQTTYTDWIIDNGLTAVDAPVVPGYTPSQATVAGIENPTADMTLADVTINYTANDQTQVVNYVDDAGKVIKTATVTGKTDQTVAVKLSVPDHYELVPGQDIPATVTLTTNNAPITVKVTPKMAEVTDPSQLSKTISRKIIINVPGKEPRVITQMATFIRTGKYNEVTGQITYTDWKVSDNGLTAYDAEHVAGYTPNITHVDAVANPSADVELTNIVIGYTAIESTGKISYQDKAGNEIGTTSISGKTGDSIGVDPAAPAGWKIVAGQDIPKNVVVTGDGIPTVIVKVEHATITVKPGEQAPHGPVSGDPSKTYEQMANLTSQPTRKIIVTKPDGSQQTITQTADFTRTATFDEVTGEVTYSSWHAVDGQDTWLAYIPATLPGYTVEQAVAARAVTGDTSDTIVKIGYIAIDQSVTICFVDDDNGVQVAPKIVKTGKTGQTIADLNLTIPDHYMLAAGHPLPTSYKFTAAKDQAITVHLVEKRVSIDPTDPKTNPDPQDSRWFKDHHLVKEIVRTIVDELPGGMKLTMQTATLYRTAIYNEATGQILTLGDWSTDAWDGYRVNAPAGYTAKVEQLVDDEVRVINVITPEEVTVSTPGQVIMITYAPKSTPTSPTTPTHPTVPTSPTIPTAPTVPTSPTKPTKPTKPTEPTEPTSPTTPTHPTAPTVPTSPTTPTAPTVPTSPTEPTAPTVPTSPTTPTHPTAPTSPTTPTHPTAPTTPTAPTSPTTPTHPTGPTSPTKPTAPTVPTSPTHPTAPTAPTTLTYPTAPTSPTNPPAPADPVTVTGETTVQDTFAVNRSRNTAGSGQVSGMTGTGQDSNNDLISSQMMQNADEKQQTNQLPQTGNSEGKQASTLGLAFATLASLIGMTGIKRKKEDK